MPYRVPPDNNAAIIIASGSFSQPNMNMYMGIARYKYDSPTGILEPVLSLSEIFFRNESGDFVLVFAFELLIIFFLS
jgi:hypothetical protein